MDKICSAICFYWPRWIFSKFWSWITKYPPSLFDNAEHDTSDGNTKTQHHHCHQGSGLCENTQLWTVWRWYMTRRWYGCDDLYTVRDWGHTSRGWPLPTPASLSCSLPYFSSLSMIRLWARIVETMQWPCTFLHSLQEISRYNCSSIGPQTCFLDMSWCFVYSCPIHAEYLSHITLSCGLKVQS